MLQKKTLSEPYELIKDIKPAAEIVKEVWTDFNEAVKNPFNKSSYFLFSSPANKTV